MLKNKPTKAALLPQQEVINEQDEEQESDSEMPQIASNTTFKESFDEDDKYSQYHQMVERQAKGKPQKAKQNFSTDKSNDESPGVGRSGLKSSKSGGLGHNPEEKKIAGKPIGYQAKRDYKRMSLIKKDSGLHAHAGGGALEEEKQPQDRPRQEEPRKSGLVKSSVTLAGSLLKGVSSSLLPKFYATD